MIYIFKTSVEPNEDIWVLKTPFEQISKAVQMEF